MSVPSVDSRDAEMDDTKGNDGSSNEIDDAAVRNAFSGVQGILNQGSNLLGTLGGRRKGAVAGGRRKGAVAGEKDVDGRNKKKSCVPKQDDEDSDMEDRDDNSSFDSVFGPGNF